MTGPVGSDESSVAAHPFASVVVPTWNRAALLADTLACLKRQDYPPEKFEIIVVDDGSTDATAEVVRQFDDGGAPRLSYVRLEHQGLNAARNAGISASTGDPVCFTDDDVDLPSGWLGILVEGARRYPEAGCLGGPVRVRFESAPPRYCGMEPMDWIGELDHGPHEQQVQHVHGCNLSIRRWAVQRVGGFNESLPIYWEELEWERRLGHAGIPIIYLPSAWIWHRRTRSDVARGKLLKRRIRHGIGFGTYSQLRGDAVSFWKIAWPIPFYLIHAVQKRCFGAILEVGWKIGILWGASSVRWKRRSQV